MGGNTKLDELIKVEKHIIFLGFFSYFVTYFYFKIYYFLLLKTYDNHPQNLSVCNTDRETPTVKAKIRLEGSVILSVGGIY